MIIELTDLEFFDKKCIIPIYNGFRLFIDKKHKIKDYFNNPDLFYDTYLNNKEMFDNKRCTKESLFRSIKNAYIRVYHLSNEIKYISNEEFLKDKKILIDYNFNISDEKELLEFIKKYINFIDNIYVNLDENYDGYVHIYDAYLTIMTIKQLTKKIKSLHLSPIEEIMYTYDIVRNRVYNGESKKEPAYLSRGLYFILNGDNIVCSGYSVFFKSLLKYMGYNCKTVTLEEKNSKDSHSRNVAYIKDDKYNIDGVYYFDATWDCKKVDNYFLNQYLYFAKTKKQMEELSPGLKKNFKIINNSDKKIERYLKDFLNNKSEESYKNINLFEKNYEFIDKMSDLVYDDDLFLSDIVIDTNYYKGNYSTKTEYKKSVNKFLNSLKKLYKCYDSPISLDKMVKIFNNVRKVEYCENPNLYPYDIDSVYETIDNSDWDKMDGLFSYIDEKEINEVIINNNIERDISNIKGYVKLINSEEYKKI